jgi:hypothetical protein
LSSTFISSPIHLQSSLSIYLHFYYLYLYLSFLFKRVRKIAKKATISFVISVRLSTWNNLVPNGQFFIKFDIWVFLKNLSRKFKAH